MLAIERQNRILSNLQINQTALVSELSKEYNVTEETIRRDLEKLEKSGYIKKTYGGAIYGQDMHTDIAFRMRARRNSNIDEHLHIANKAAEYVLDGETIMLDASANSLHLIRALRQKKDLRIITNSVEILTMYGFVKNIRIISTGGVLQESGASLVGPAAERAIRAFHVDKAFLSCEGLSQNDGATDTDELEAQVKTAMALATKQVVLMVSAEKFDEISFTRFLAVEQMNIIVTDRKPMEHWISFLDEHEIEWSA
jgi:DeoR/GlpR family transcriptional regulator of sugar metabolism